VAGMVDNRGRSGDRFAGSGSRASSRTGGGASSSAGSSASSRRCGGLVVWVLDTELNRVLEFAVGVIDQLDAIVRRIRLEISGRSPFVRSTVGNTINDCAQRLDVEGRSAKKNERDGALLGG